jgi:lipoate-protein ligase A
LKQDITNVFEANYSCYRSKTLLEDELVLEKVLDLPKTEWRIINTGISDGITNMAIDSAIMHAISKKDSISTLRFYGWDPPCVSIGYSQSINDINLEKCRKKGYTWVRRPTGGRAVLHIDELTYSVIAPIGEARVSGDILTSYNRISHGLLAGLQLLGGEIAQAGLQKNYNTYNKSASCFEVPSHYEVTAFGRKLIGSAQVRRMGVVLQHGSLPLKGSVSRLIEVLDLSQSEREQLSRRLNKRAIALDEALGQFVSFEEVVDAIVSGFSQVLNLDFQEGALSEYEVAETKSLKKQYRSTEWTFNK